MLSSQFQPRALALLPRFFLAVVDQISVLDGAGVVVDVLVQGALQVGQQGCRVLGLVFVD